MDFCRSFILFPLRDGFFPSACKRCFVGVGNWSTLLCASSKVRNNAFAGKQRLMPFFNRSNNKVLILSVQSAGVSNGRNGFFLRKRFAMTARTNPARIENRRKPILSTKMRQTCRVRSYRLTAFVATLRKNTCSNTAPTAPTAPTLSIPSTSAARNFLITTHSACQCQA